MLAIENKIYTAALRWKQGEMEALDQLDDVSKDRLLPHLVFPPTSARDIEKRRPLSRDEFTRIQIGRLQTYWAGRPCVVDFRFLRLDAEDRGSDAARLTDLLINARKFGCQLIPVADAQTDPYRLGSLAAHIRNSALGGAVRIGLADLQDPRLEEMLKALVAGIGLSYSDCILIVDLSEAEIADPKAFARFTGEWLAKLRHVGSWKRVIVEASSYPTRNPALRNSTAKVPRNEWLSWSHLVATDKGVAEWASFGDFGADHGQIDFRGGGRTITHLRYTTRDNWIVARGDGDPTHDHDGTIYNVARQIAGSGEFLGETFSAGDEFIARCAAGNVHGNSSNWRRVNMVHHMTLATSGAAALVGKPFEKPKHVPAPKQLSILPAGQ